MDLVFCGAIGGGTCAAVGAIGSCYSACYGAAYCFSGLSHNLISHLACGCLCFKLSGALLSCARLCCLSGITMASLSFMSPAAPAATNAAAGPPVQIAPHPKTE